ncbi:MAG: putative transporter, ATPase and permease component [Chlamydiales bacterium]|jgi:ATP-binding cassette subfamily B protein|nr:putative transporter, ATPase and permease component [Chlamydiales bacterium]
MPETRSLTAFYLYFAKPFWLKFLGIALTSIIWALYDSAGPYLIKLIIDKVTTFEGKPQDVFEVIKWPLGSFIGLRLFMEGCNILQGIIGIYTYSNFRQKIASELFAYVQQHSYSYFLNQFTGGTSSRIVELARSGVRLSSMLLQDFMPLLCSFLISAYLMWTIHPIFATVLLVWMLTYLTLVVSLINKKSVLFAKKHAEAATLVKGRISDSLSNIVNSRLFARADYEQQYLESYLHNEAERHQDFLWYLEKVRAFQRLFSSALIIMILVLALYGWSLGKITIGDFSFIVAATISILSMAWHIANQATKLFEEIGSASDSLKIISEPIEIKNSDQAKPLDIQNGEIELDNISFTYSSSTQPIFTCLNLKIKGREKIGLVGFSGSGKSTFAHLLLRYFELSEGHIFIDGQDITQVTQQSLREQISMIPQDVTLFHRTLIENIRYGRLNASDEEVIEAAKKAHCHEFIEQLPKGYYTLVGERGTRLSGGQRQRIAIARAILKNSPILILDEATSALDSATEQAIQSGLKHVMEEKTCIVIAHRLSTLIHMDRIIVFLRGKIVEDGHYTDLLKQKGHFAKLWEMQTGGALPEMSNNIEHDSTN